MTRSAPRRIRPEVLTVGIALIALMGSLSACSSSSAAPNPASTSAANVHSEAACVSKANAFLVPYEHPQTALPADYKPLPSKPAPGGKIIRIVTPIPSDAENAKADNEAARSVGWSASSITSSGTAQDFAAKVQEAISQHPTAIVLGGVDPALISQGIAEAKANGIIVGLSSVVEAPTSYPGFAAGVEGPASGKLVQEINAYKFMAESNCSASVLFVSLDYPIIQAEQQDFVSTVHANCPMCKVAVTTVQAANIGTPEAVSQVVASLQSDPSIKYVNASIANLATGVSTALDQAGLTGVQIFGSVPDQEAVAALRNGTNAWYISEGPDLTGWLEVYSVLLAYETKKPVELPPEPLTILTKDNLPPGNGLPVYPTNYQDLFKELFHVG
jgi:ABC-type sugar transport system substrate-binding protein